MTEATLVAANSTAIMAGLRDAGLGSWILRSWLVDRHFAQSIVLSLPNARTPHLVGVDLVDKEDGVVVTSWRVTETGTTVRDGVTSMRTPISSDQLLEILKDVIGNAEVGGDSTFVEPQSDLSVDRDASAVEVERVRVSLGSAVVGDSLETVQAARLASEVEDYLHALTRLGIDEGEVQDVSVTPEASASVEPVELVYEVRDASILEGLPHTIVSTSYLLIENGWSLRVRRSYRFANGRVDDHVNRLEVKGPRSSHARQEVEIIIDDAMATALYVTGFQKTTKRVFEVLADDIAWTVEEYLLADTGLVIARAELEQDLEPSSMRNNSWLGDPISPQVLPESGAGARMRLPEPEGLELLRRPRGGANAREQARSARSRASLTRSQTEEIREWAREHGYTVSSTGRIPAAVLEAYSSTE